IESAMALAQDLQAAREKANKEEFKETFAKAKEHASAAGEALTGAAGRYRQAFDAFINEIKRGIDDSKTEEEKIFYISKVLLYCASSLVGIYLGNSIHGKCSKMFDLARHRGMFVHSVIPTIFIKLLAKLMLRLVDAVYAKICDGEEGKETLVLIKRNLGMIANGMSFGGVSHPIQGGVLNLSGVVGGIDLDLTNDSTTLDDHAFLVVNAFFRSLFGGGFVVDARHEARKSAA
ncbi:MAG: hypothetical protein OYH77_06435, partial [Pseudomonadota bacterium]|nr:hypothetical protein [Pseudomonadota bacterium]